MKALISSLVLVTAVATASAQSINLSVDYTGSYNLSGDSLGMLDLTQNQPAPTMSQFDIFLSVTGLTTGQDLVSLQVSMNRPAGVSYDSVFGTDGFTLNNPIIDPPNYGLGSNAGAANVFSTLSSGLNAATDTLVWDMTRGSTTGTYGDYAAFQQLGETQPFLVGTLTLEWDGVTTGVLSWRNPGTWNLVINNNTNGAATSVGAESFASGATLTAESIQFGGVIPEPASLALLAIGGLFVGVGRRRA
jgi:hypothetical protein